MSQRAAKRDAAGAVLPTRLMVLSISVVALGGLAFFATQGEDADDDRTGTSISSTAPLTPSTPPITEGPGGPATTEPPPPTATPKAPKPVNKAKTDVLILNNTNRTGFAGMVRTRAERFDWNVTNTGNWQGSVDATTVYYGPGLKEAARLLAAALKIKRYKPLFETDDLSPKRLNVILTDDYS